ncbi:MAG: hypothetical protein AAFO58_10385, partial [Pseudomonadota bacterium]
SLPDPQLLGDPDTFAGGLVPLLIPSSFPTGASLLPGLCPLSLRQATICFDLGKVFWLDP